MSYQEIAQSMIDRLPEDKMIFVINMLEGLGEMSGLDLYPDFKPNETTEAAMAETDEMIRTGSGQHFEGATEELFFRILEEQPLLKLNLTSRFKRDLKLCKKRSYNISLLNAVVNTLRIPAALPPKNKDHVLKGNYIGRRECHIFRTGCLSTE